jgi:hypothetical protein
MGELRIFQAAACTYLRVRMLSRLSTPPILRLIYLNWEFLSILAMTVSQEPCSGCFELWISNLSLIMEVKAQLVKQHYFSMKKKSLPWKKKYNFSMPSLFEIVYFQTENIKCFQTLMFVSELLRQSAFVVYKEVLPTHTLEYPLQVGIPRNDLMVICVYSMDIIFPGCTFNIIEQIWLKLYLYMNNEVAHLLILIEVF